MTLSKESSDARALLLLALYQDGKLANDEWLLPAEFMTVKTKLISSWPAALVEKLEPYGLDLIRLADSTPSAPSSPITSPNGAPEVVHLTREETAQERAKADRVHADRENERQMKETQIRLPSRAIAKGALKWIGVVLGCVALWWMATTPATWREALNPIAEIGCIGDAPVLLLRPKSSSKAPIAIMWNVERKRWETAIADDEYGPAPEGIFVQESNGWWVDRHEPLFGKRTAAWIDIVTTVESWRWSHGRWTGTKRPPLISVR